ncbi:MAG TPA: hypothetical protein VFR64_10455, partial [Methylomirabilota bacterium]|nr:hypothetical protein [Methylomirabilota bacterium]
PSPYFELGMDWEFSRQLGASWLVDGSYYRPHQLTGAYTFTTMVDNLYPPHALFLFVPFVYLPAFAWWAIPAVIVALAFRRLRPATWAWVLMLALLAWPRSISAVLLGNTDIWVVAMLAAALTWGWPAVLLTIKPTFAPLILLGLARPRQTALAGLGLIVLAAPGLPLWFDYAAALRNVQIDPSHPLGTIPLMLIPFVARLTSTRSRSTA